MNQKINTVVGFIIIAIMAITMVVFTYIFSKKQDEIAQIQIPVPVPIQKEIDQNKADLADTQPNTNAQELKTYQDRASRFEFKYPPTISINDNVASVSLSHSIVYKHNDSCDFKGDAPMLNKLTDLNVSIQLFDKSLKDTVIANESVQAYDSYFKNNGINLSPGFIDKFSAGSLDGYQITNSVEGCGEYLYYFPISPSETLAIKRQIISEFQPINADSPKNLSLPGIIPPSQEEAIFKQILSTFKLTDKNNISNKQGCINSGGIVVAVSSFCDPPPDDFPQQCSADGILIMGGCSGAPNTEEYPRFKTCNCGPDKCFDGSECVVIKL